MKKPKQELEKGKIVLMGKLSPKGTKYCLALCKKDCGETMVCEAEIAAALRGERLICAPTLKALEIKEARFLAIEDTFVQLKKHGLDPKGYIRI